MISQIRSSSDRFEILSLLSKMFSIKDKVKLFFIVATTICLSLLDLIGVILIGVVGTLSVAGIQSTSPTATISRVLVYFNLESFSFQTQVTALSLIAASILIVRTILSIFFTRRILKFFALRSGQTTVALVDRLLSSDLTYIQARPMQETIHGLTSGASALMIGVFATSINLVGDYALLVVLSLGMFFVNPLVALSAIVFFSIVGFTMHQLLNVRAERLGALEAKLNVESNSAVAEIVSSFRELRVLGRQQFYIKKISKLRSELAETHVETSFMPHISKYVIESALIVGAVCISAIQFIVFDASQAVATLAIFLASGSRLAPALLRIQQGNIQIRNSLGVSRRTLILMDELPKYAIESSKVTRDLDFNHEGFVPSIAVNNLVFTYPNAQRPAVNIKELQIDAGSMVAFVGASGAGKTTLADVLLGMLLPGSGQITVSGASPIEAVKKWPGAISYVPQETYIANSSIYKNVALGFQDNEIDESRVVESLKLAQLWEFVRNLQRGFETKVGERGTQLSGGQRQRLGIARALYTNPKLIILDEATSSLDVETERDISESLQNLKRKVTLIVIAHRLSTIKEADVVHYIKSGQIIGSGTFDQLRRDIPSFDASAAIMGL